MRSITLPADPGEQGYRRDRVAHWDHVAESGARQRSLGRAYHARLEEIYRFLVAPGQRVLEVGCGEGDLIAALRPSVGVGVDFSGMTVSQARTRHPGLYFVQADAHALPLAEPFDVIVLSDLVNDVWDVEAVFREVLRVATPRTLVILNFYSRLWELPLRSAQKLGLATPLLEQNWLTVSDVSNLLRLADFEVIRAWDEILLPADGNPAARLANHFLAKLWPLDEADLTHFITARPSSGNPRRSEPTVSVVVPARNEAGNIAEVFSRTPEMGGGTELVFVEGHSKDDTYAAIEREITRHPERRAQLLRQTGRGKGDAVRQGFEHASGDVLMILDADLTVPPEDLPRFYAALRDGKGDFINGVRLVYPMQREAMRFLNFLGNKFFSLAFSWLLGQSVKDTLCGTKVLWKADYERIAANRAYFGDFDPFGDFDLLFGAAKQNLRIVDLPIRYRERTYGTTNIERWKHGLLLLRMVLFAARRIKFI